MLLASVMKCALLSPSRAVPNWIGTALACALCLTAISESAAPVSARQEPRVFLLDAQALASARSQALSGDQRLTSALSQLRRTADAALRQGPLSVTDKQAVPPSGDKRDYMSLSVYWWPDPNTADGLPYVNRDGRSNPEAADPDRYDATRYRRMVRAVEDLALGYYLTGTDAYAQHAALLIRAWFLDESSRMNPNLQFSQLIPGRPAARGVGILDGRDLARVVDAVGLLDGSPSWSPWDQTALQRWFGDLVDWLLESPQGQMEARAPNNHGTWFDVQVALFARFAGRDEVATRVLSASVSRINAQIQPDGSQPLELRRTLALHYSLFNLKAFFSLAALAEPLQIDLWNYGSEDGRSLRKALEFLLPYVMSDEPWPYSQIAPVNFMEDLAPSLQKAVVKEGWPGAATLERISSGQVELRLLRLSLGYMTP